MRNSVRPASIVTVLLLLLAFPVAGLAGGGPGTVGPPYGSPPGKTTATIVGDAIQFRPCSFEVTFAASDPDDDISVFKKASGDFPTYHNIRGGILSGDPNLSGDSSTCDMEIWTSTVWAVDDEGTDGTASDPLILECKKDRNDIPTAPRFTIQPTAVGASRSQPTVIGGTAYGCCFNVSLSSTTPGRETEFEFIQVSGDLPPDHRQSGDEIIGCTANTRISGDTASGNDLYIPPRWISKWRARNKNNRCEKSEISTLTLTCRDF